MKLIIEDYKDAKAAIAGLFQFEENAKFTQTILAVTENSFLFYNDNKPDMVEGDNYKYNVKLRLNIEDYPLVVVEKIAKNYQLSNMGRLNFWCDEPEKCFEFYYFLNDKRDVQELIKELKNSGIKIKKRKVDLALDTY